MDKNMMETISAAYTTYTLTAPEERVIVGIDAFAEAFQANLKTLEQMMNQPKPEEQRISVRKAEDTLQKGLQKAEQTLQDENKMASLLEKLQQKMNAIPMVGSVLANLPTMFKLLNSYLKNEYTDIPRKAVLFIVSAVTYLVSPIDLIPDLVPLVGILDDMAVISVCVNATKDELEKYLTWRKANGLDQAANG